jgi:hypothetical protein
MSSYAPEVIADETGNWIPNALRFRTKGEAEAYVRDLAYRWIAVREGRVVFTDDPPNHTLIGGNLRAL